MLAYQILNEKQFARFCPGTGKAFKIGNSEIDKHFSDKIVGKKNKKKSKQAAKSEPTFTGATLEMSSNKAATNDCDFSKIEINGFNMNEIMAAGANRMSLYDTTIGENFMHEVEFISNQSKVAPASDNDRSGSETD